MPRLPTFVSVLVIAVAGYLSQGCSPALQEGVMTAADSAALLWLAGRGIPCSGACTAPPPAPTLQKAAPTTDELLQAMAYGAAISERARDADAQARALQRIAAEVLAERARAAGPAPVAVANPEAP